MGATSDATSRFAQRISRPEATEADFITAKLAARANAAAISDAEIEDLRNQRKHLLQKLVDGEISIHEKHRLELVRWSLERVEDARYGAGLDQLEAKLVRYESLLEEIRSLKKSLDKLKAPKNRA